jgi:hypothetical protein
MADLSANDYNAKALSIHEYDHNHAPLKLKSVKLIGQEDKE